MKVPKYREQSLKALDYLTHAGFPPAVQQRLGALTVIWGIFESNLETTIWALRSEEVEGTRPSTDKTSISAWIDQLAEGSSKFSGNTHNVLASTAIAAKDLMEYRHALMHGYIIPFPDMPTFIRNPRWHGELRRRPSTEAHVDENLLDLAIDTIWILCRVLFATRNACNDSSKAVILATLEQDVVRAKSQANELRHMTALMNHEQY